jgi:hypothetical protein
MVMDDDGHSIQIFNRFDRGKHTCQFEIHKMQLPDTYQASLSLTFPLSFSIVFLLGHFIYLSRAQIF